MWLTHSISYTQLLGRYWKQTHSQYCKFHTSENQMTLGCNNGNPLRCLLSTQADTPESNTTPLSALPGQCTADSKGSSSISASERKESRHLCIQSSITQSLRKYLLEDCQCFLFNPPCIKIDTYNRAQL